MHLFKTLLSALLIITCSAVLVYAQNAEHQVQDEETLFSIAQKYGVTVQQLKNWNHLSSNTLSIGQILIIKQHNERRTRTYTVKPNDTLFSIAQRFGVSVTDIRNWNHLKDSILTIGATLVIQPESTETFAPQKPISSGESENTYTVKSGDTLFRIAQMYTMEVEELMRINNLTSNNIRVGQQLKIAGGNLISGRTKIDKKHNSKPGAAIPYELKRGMRLADLLAMFKMDRDEFEKLNPELKANYYSKGQIVNVRVPGIQNNPPGGNDDELHMLGTVEVTKYRASLTGTTTTSGELYNPGALTAAHSRMAIGSVIFVKNRNNGCGVLVRINDRTTEKGLKLSEAAWNALGLTGNAARVTMYRNDE